MRASLLTPPWHLGDELDAARPDAPATRLVTSGERMGGAVTTPDGKALVYSSDHGADENWSYFRVNLDGSGLVELTPNARRQRDGALIADGKPDTIFYSARTMSDAGTTVYATSVRTPGDEKVVFHDDKPGALIDVSRDGAWGLYERTPSQSENYLVAVDLATGATRPIYPASGQVTISGAAISAYSQPAGVPGKATSPPPGNSSAYSA